MGRRRWYCNSYLPQILCGQQQDFAVILNLITDSYLIVSVWRIFLILFFYLFILPNTVKVCSLFFLHPTRTTTCTLYRCLTFFLIFYSMYCLANQRFSLCPHCANSYRLTSTSIRHSDFYSYSITAPTATTNVNLLCGIHRTQWGNKYRNTTSTHYFLIPSPSSPLSSPPDMGVILFLVLDSSHHFSLRDRNTARPREQTPRISTTDWRW